MATLQELESALVKADAAGNVDDARAFAAEIRRMRAQPRADFSGVASAIDTTAERTSPLTEAEWQRERERQAASTAEDEASNSYGKYMAGVGMSVRSLADGLKQAPVAGLANQAVLATLGANKVAPGNSASRWIAQNIANPLLAKAAEQQRIEALKRRDESSIRNSRAGQFGNIVGTAAQFLLPGAALRGTVLGGAILPTTIGGNALQGAVVGALQPTAEGESRAQNTVVGGLLGGGGAALPVIPATAARVTRGLLAPFTESGAESAAARVVLGAAENPAQIAAMQQSAVPGVQRTLAEATLDPGIAQLQRTVAAKNGAPFDQIRRSNNAARVAAIRQFAGDEADLAAAEAARNSAASPLLRSALEVEGVNTNRLIGQLGRLAKAQEGRPAVQKAITDIADLLKREVPEAERIANASAPLKEFIATDRLSATNREVAADAIRMMKAGERPGGSFVAPKGTRASASQQAGREAMAQARKAYDRAAVGHDKVAVLYNVRKTINDMLAGKYGGDSAQALAGSGELIAVRNQLDRVLEKQAPEFGQYLDAYRSASKPINRMEAAQELLRRAGSATVDPTTGLETLTPAAFGRQARNLDQVAASGTGFRKARASDVFDPSDLNTISQVNEDLSRQAFADTAARGVGSDAFQKLMTNGDILGAAQELGVNIPGSGIIKMLGTRGRDRVNQQLVEILTDPSKAQSVLVRATPNERRVIEQVLRASGGRLGVVLTPEAE